MSHTINFRRAKLVSLSLARVGNPLRNEPLRTSKELCHFSPEDEGILTPSFLKPFQNLESKALSHHSSLEMNEVWRSAAECFERPDALLAEGKKVARHLYDISKHPNIKSGDLCIALVQDVLVNGDACRALSIIKSESRVPFLEITDTDGSLTLVTHQGISPEKIDKGCLIIDTEKDNGYLVYTFDKTSSGTHFWVRDFLGAKFRRNDDYMTRRYADMCVSFAKEGLPEEMGAEQKHRVASQTMDYFQEKEEFDLDNFRQEALKEPDLIEKFDSYRGRQSGGDDEGAEEEDEKLDEQFTIAKKIAKKASSKFRSGMKLDCGVNISFTPAFQGADEEMFQRGVDEETGLKYVKIYYEEEL
ncbi:MAG: nucleoid-associated protein [Akkermansiaceae bacterium]